MKQDYVTVVLKDGLCTLSCVKVSRANLACHLRIALLSHGFKVGPGGFNAENLAEYLFANGSALISDFMIFKIVEYSRS